MFISEHFLASEFINKYELPPLLAANKSNKVTVLPVFLSPSTVEKSGIEFLNPDTGKKEVIKLTEFQGFGTPKKTLEEHNSAKKKRTFVELAARIRELAAKNPTQVEEEVVVNKVVEVQKKNKKLNAESDKRLKKLKKSVVYSLSKLNGALPVLEDHLSNYSDYKASNKAGEDTSKQLMERLMGLSFEHLKTVLLQTYEELEERDNQSGKQIVTKISRLLLPWLFVSSENVDIDVSQFEISPGSLIRTIPAGLVSIVELILAGIDRREAFYEQDNEEFGFPVGRYGVQLPALESGLQDRAEEILRDDLFLKTKPPTETSSLSSQEKDTIIENQINFFMKEGYRTYLICWLPEDEGEKSRYITKIEGIKRCYPSLEIISLDRRLMPRDQKLFNEIRKIMRQESQ
ncbi:MAG: hypothetical protein HQL68_06380 [Magnetococcales bacterium]|nr:hypothetical protein [Magnetococcales bacterium]